MAREPVSCDVDGGCSVSRISCQGSIRIEELGLVGLEERKASSRLGDSVVWFVCWLV